MKGGEIKKGNDVFTWLDKHSDEIRALSTSSIRLRGDHLFFASSIFPPKTLSLFIVYFFTDQRRGKKKKSPKIFAIRKLFILEWFERKPNLPVIKKPPRFPLKTSFYSKKRTSYEGKKC